MPQPRLGLDAGQLAGRDLVGTERLEGGPGRFPGAELTAWLPGRNDVESSPCLVVRHSGVGLHRPALTVDVDPRSG